jgi:SH3 domain protein
MKQWFNLFGIAALLLLVSLSVRAEIAYVSDGVKLGVHQQAALSSTILTLVAAGTALEVLEQKNGLVKVRLGGGTEGWVDGRYLSKNITPSQKADGLEAELVQTSAELAKARELAAELKYQLNRERERAKIVQADLLKAREKLRKKPSDGGNRAAASADALQKLRKTSEENQRLNKRILELETKLESAESGPGEKPAATVKPNPSHHDDASLLSHYTAITEWQLWQIMLLFFGLLLAFAVGGYLVDWEVRRRHGGFRV